jgi:hypothetical protein
MARIAQRDIIEASRDPEGLALLLPKLKDFPRIFTQDNYKEAYPLIDAPIPDVTPSELVHKHFPDDEVAFLIAAKRAILIYTNKGRSVEHFYGTSKKFLEMHRYEDDAISTAFTVLCRLERQHKLSTPEGIIADDLRQRTHRVELNREKRIDSFRDAPDDLWEALDCLAKWSTCFDEFKDTIESNGNVLNSSNRNLGRISRATYGLDNPQHKSEDQINIYRSSGDNEEIAEGDWVSISEAYAEQHLHKNLDSTCCVHNITAYPDEIYDTSSPDEQVYVPRGTWKDFDSLESVYLAITNESKPLHYPEVKARTIEEINHEKSNDITY